MSSINEGDFLKADEEEKKEGRNRSNKYGRHTTTGSLTVNTHSIKCVFCKDEHYPDKCNVVTDMQARTEVIRNSRLCYKRLQPFHGIRNCRSEIKCFKCQSIRHRTATCEGEHGKQHEDLVKNDVKPDGPPTHTQTVTHFFNYFFYAY